MKGDPFEDDGWQLALDKSAELTAAEDEVERLKAEKATQILMQSSHASGLTELFTDIPVSEAPPLQILGGQSGTTLFHIDKHGNAITGAMMASGMENSAYLAQQQAQQSQYQADALAQSQYQMNELAAMQLGMSHQILGGRKL